MGKLDESVTGGDDIDLNKVKIPSKDAPVADDGTTEPPPKKAPKEEKSELAKTLEALRQEVSSQTTLQQITSDPEIAAILKAKREGKPVTVNLEGEKEPEQKPVEEEPPDLDDMDNKQLTNFIVKQVAKELDGVINRKLKTLEEPLKGVQNFVNTSEENRIKTEIKEARDRYSDFDDFKAPMLQLHRENPGLKVEQLYVLAKHMEGGPKDKKDSGLESERPDQSTSRFVPKKKEVQGRGRQGFGNILEDALERLQM